MVVDNNKLLGKKLFIFSTLVNERILIQWILQILKATKVAFVEKTIDRLGYFERALN